jgi:hypothetical protein
MRPGIEQGEERDKRAREALMMRRWRRSILFGWAQGKLMFFKKRMVRRSCPPSSGARISMVLQLRATQQTK